MSKDLKIFLEDLTVIYEKGTLNETTAVSGINLNVNAGEFVSLLGISGCGKTTVLNAVAGFIKPTEGNVLVNNSVINAPNPNCGVVFQKDALFSWMTVVGNIGFGNRIRKLPQQQRKEKIFKLLNKLGLKGVEKLYPYQLSGGMAQRVEIARALANEPEVLLLDEPFSKIDAQTRLQIQQLLLKIWRDYNLTILFVTHDIDEALFLSDRIIVFTRAPAKIKKQIVVDIPRPREYSIVLSQEFLEIKKQIFSLIEEEFLTNF